MGIFAKRKEHKAAKARQAAEDEKIRKLTTDTSSHNPYAQSNMGAWGEAKRAIVNKDKERAQSISEDKAPPAYPKGSSFSKAYGGNAYGPHNKQPAPLPRSRSHSVLGGDPNMDPNSKIYPTPPVPSQSYDQPPPYDDRTTYDDLSPHEQPTAEEEEEEDVECTKQEIRFVKNETVANTRRALMLAGQINETGEDSLARLGMQGEYLDSTDMNLNMATVGNREAEAKIRELDRYNRSMWANARPNPTRRGQDKKIDKMVKQHQEDRQIRSDARRLAFQKGANMDSYMRTLKAEEEKDPETKKAAGIERAKYQFEADSDDERLENEIDENYRLLGGAVGRAKIIAEATGKELEMQNQQLNSITGKVRTNLLNDVTPAHFHLTITTTVR